SAAGRGFAQSDSAAISASNGKRAVGIESSLEDWLSSPHVGSVRVDCRSEYGTAFTWSNPSRLAHSCPRARCTHKRCPCRALETPASMPNTPANNGNPGAHRWRSKRPRIGRNSSHEQGARLAFRALACLDLPRGGRDDSHGAERFSITAGAHDRAVPAGR